jgi:anion-transporting  ArsA/GET3 family ATPase
MSDWPGVRLHVVTGKGGTGKTTVAAALALALASSDQRVLLCEAEGRQGIARLFDVPPLPYEERSVALGAGGGEVHALAIDPEGALHEYLDMFYHLGRAGRALDRFGVVEFATTIAPGVRDVLLTGKVYEAFGRTRKDKSRVYDAIVLDAPPTGRITRFLNVNTEVAGLAKAGPIRKQADAIMEVLRSPRTAVHLVTLLEEMPVQETADGVAELRAADLPVGKVIVNMVRPHILDEGAVRSAAGDRRTDIAKALTTAGVSGSAKLVTPLLEQAADHAQRVELEREQRAALSVLGLPAYELPLLSEGVDLAGLYQLAKELRKQGTGS